MTPSAAPALARLRLLGRFSLDVPGAHVPLESASTEVLIAYLVVTGGSVPRERLAALLWPESTQAQARTNLRKLLHTVRARMPDIERYLDITERGVGWRTDAPCRIDVEEFRRVLAADDPEADEVHRAVGLYRGDLLATRDHPWLDHERDRLRTLYREGLRRLAVHHEEAGDLPAAVTFARRAIEAEPLREEGYRHLMRLHAMSGEQALALSVYHDCSTTLERELGVSPSAATRAGYAELVRGTGRPPPPATARGRFVGRARERARLGAAWAAADAGSTAMVLVTGEAGAGKTRLTEEFLHWCTRQGAVVARARCLGTEEELAYGPVTTWLRQPALRAGHGALPEHVRQELARLLPELGTAPDRAAARTGAERRRLLHDAVVAALVGGDRTVVLGLDDLQQADAETCDLVRHLLLPGPDARSLLVATLRSEDVVEDTPARRLVLDLRADHRCSEIQLGPLSAAETAALAAGMGTELDDDAAGSLWQQTAGNPLFAVEAVRAAQSGDRSPSTQVQAVIETRLDRLTTPTRALVDVAAVAGPEFDAGVLGSAGNAPEDVVVAALDELWRRRIVRDLDGGRYGFTHEIVRDVAAGRVPPARRRMLHRRVAQALESRPGSAQDSSGRIAPHYAAAGDPARAVTHYVRAAEIAHELNAHAHAVTLSQRALEQLHLMPASPARDRAELDIRRTQLAPLSSAHGYAAPDLIDVQRRATELSMSLGVDLAPELLRSSAMSALTRGDGTAAIAGGHALEAAGRRTGSSALRVEGAFILGVTAFWQADFPAACAHLEAAVRLYRSADRREHLIHYGNDPKVSCLARLGNTWWFLGEPALARRASADAVAWATGIGHRYSLGIAAFFGALLALDMGDHDLLRAHVTTLAEVDTPQLTLGRDVLEGLVAVLDGEVAAGLATAREAVHRSRGEEAPGLVACLHRVLLAAELTAGDVAGARATARRMLTMGHGAQVWAAEARRVAPPPG